MASANIYGRKGLLYVVATDGLIDLEPVDIVTGPEGLAAALSRTLSAPSIVPQAHPDLRSYRWPVLAASGVRRLKDFEQGLKMIALEPLETEYTARRYVPDVINGRGFNPDAVLFQIPRSNDFQTLAARIIASLADPAWPTR